MIELFFWVLYAIRMLQAAMLFQKLVSDAKSVRVTDVTKKEDRKTRPHGLNTVDMLKVTSPPLLSRTCEPDWSGRCARFVQLLSWHSPLNLFRC